MTLRACLAFALAITFATPALAAGKPPEQDRKSILAMAGDYKVRFDMRETVPFVADYKPLEPKRSGGRPAAMRSATRSTPGTWA